MMIMTSRFGQLEVDPDRFITFGARKQLFSELGLDAESIVAAVQAAVSMDSGETRPSRISGKTFDLKV